MGCECRIWTIAGCTWGLISICSLAQGGSLPITLPANASLLSVYDWAGFYVGAHFGYSTGSSNWSAAQVGGSAPSVMDTLNFYDAFDAFKGTGSYSSGLQASYNFMISPRLLLGVETDATFPNTISATQTFSVPAFGQASYGEMVLHSGSIVVASATHLTTCCFTGPADLPGITIMSWFLAH